MKNTWTKEKQRILDKMEAELIEKGSRESGARLMAEDILEKQIDYQMDKREWGRWR